MAKKKKKAESSAIIYNGMTRKELELKVTGLYIDHNFGEEIEDWHYDFDIFSLILVGYRGYRDYSDEELIKEFNFFARKNFFSGADEKNKK
jgi:hypothetical protein